MRLVNKFLDRITGKVERDITYVDLDAVQELLGYHFHNERLLLLSLTHRSFTRYDPEHCPSNERLEFLGDSVLGLIISDQLFSDNPDLREGKLTKTKAKLVNEVALAEVANAVGLPQHLRLSPEEDRSGGRTRPSIISDAFESVIAAIYLDGGLDAARDVILRLLYTRRETILNSRAQRNFKGELLELVQGQGIPMPHYEVVSEAGPDHEKEFTVNVQVLGEIKGRGVGNTKKEAEQKAAASALRSMRSRS
ncbi:MAG TPA: ribonuclease III [candidate division Zixibacteria bacterium]|nr:ribonuclease III [candidate division Zixibacteria bacterium]